MPSSHHILRTGFGSHRIKTLRIDPGCDQWWRRTPLPPAAFSSGRGAQVKEGEKMRAGIPRALVAHGFTAGVIPPHAL